MTSTLQHTRFSLKITSPLFPVIFGLLGVFFLLIQVFLGTVEDLWLFGVFILVGFVFWKLASGFLKSFVFSSMNWWQVKYQQSTFFNGSELEKGMQIQNPMLFYLRYLFLKLLGIDTHPNNRYFLKAHIIDPTTPFYKILTKRVFDAMSATIALSFLVMVSLQFVSQDFSSIPVFISTIFEISLVSIVLISILTPMIWLMADSKIGIIRGDSFENLDDKVKKTFLNRFIGLSGLFVGYTYLSELATDQVNTTIFSFDTLFWIVTTYLRILLIIAGPLLIIVLSFLLLRYERGINSFRKRLASILPVIDFDVSPEQSEKTLAKKYDDYFRKKFDVKQSSNQAISAPSPTKPDLASSIENQSIFCTKCGAEQERSRNFCNKCGAELRRGESTATPHDGYSRDIGSANSQKFNSALRLIIGEFLLILPLYSLSYFGIAVNHVFAFFFPDVPVLYDIDVVIFRVVYGTIFLVLSSLIASYVRYGTTNPLGRPRTNFRPFQGLRNLLVNNSPVIKSVALIVGGLDALFFFLGLVSRVDTDLVSSPEEFRVLWTGMVIILIIFYIVVRILSYLYKFESEQFSHSDDNQEGMRRRTVLILFAISFLITFFHANLLIFNEDVVAFVQDNLVNLLLVDIYRIVSIALSFVFLVVFLPGLLNLAIFSNFDESDAIAKNHGRNSKTFGDRIKKFMGLEVKKDTSYFVHSRDNTDIAISDLFGKIVELVLISYMLALIIGGIIRYAIFGYNPDIDELLNFGYAYYLSTEFLILITIPLTSLFLGIVWSLEEVRIFGFEENKNLISYFQQVREGTFGKYLGYGAIFVVVELIFGGLDPIWKTILTENESYSYLLLYSVIILRIALDILFLFFIPLFIIYGFLKFVFPRIKPRILEKITDKLPQKQPDLTVYSRDYLIEGKKE